MPFTKTNRLVQLGVPSRHEVLPGDIGLIMFFGHSLSAADYSYFGQYSTMSICIKVKAVSYSITVLIMGKLSLRYALK